MQTILIVDDEPGQLTLLRMLLKHLPYTLITAQSAAEALDKAREHRPDLVLLDVAMPMLSGLHVLREFRQDPQLTSIKTILVTAVPARISPQDAATAFAILVKPFGTERLEAVVQKALGTGI